MKILIAAIRQNIILLLIVTISILVLLPILNFFPEGDDLLFLWHIRVPVDFSTLPFYGWEEPIAGRFGYGQAWLGGAIYRIFGLQPLVFNIVGIIVKIIALVAIYIFCNRLTKTKTIALLSALFFATTSVGLNGIVNLFLHFSLIFLALFLLGTSLFFQGIETQSKLKIILGTATLLLSNYLYTIRAIGIALLPFWALTRLQLHQAYRLKFFSVLLSIAVVATSILMVSNLIPGASSYATQTLIDNSISILHSTLIGHYEYVRSAVVSVCLMLMPRHFYSIIDQLTYADLSTNRFLIIYSPLIWTIMYSVFIIPILQSSTRKTKIIAFLGIITGFAWNLCIFTLRHKGIIFYYGGELSTIVFGFYFYILSIFTGIVYLSKNPRIGSVLLCSLSAAILFYIPNWLHDPVIISGTESRYFTISSGFISIAFGTLGYILISSQYDLIKRSNSLLKLIGSFLFIVTCLIVSGIIFIHLAEIDRILTLNASIRQEKIIQPHWKYVRSNVDFSKQPLIVVVWAGTQIDNAKREFFRHQSLGLIGNLAWDYQLKDKYKLFYSYKDSMDAICAWEDQGINFDPANFYDFNLTSDRQIINLSTRGREKLKTWNGYCQDLTIKGLEVND